VKCAVKFLECVLKFLECVEKLSPFKSWNLFFKSLFFSSYFQKVFNLNHVTKKSRINSTFPESPVCARIWPDLAKILARFWPGLARSGQILTRSGQILARLWPELF
jgi:hypothetical protein